MQDIVEFLEKNKWKNLVIYSFAWNVNVRVRLVIFQGFLGGVFTFREFVKFMVPRVYRSQKLWDKYFDYVNTTFEAMLRRDGDGSLSFYGHPFSFSTQNYAEELEFFEQIALFDQYRARDVLKADSIVIDAGANIGVFSLFASRLAPEGHVYAFEPVRVVYDILQKNVIGYPNITAFGLGLGEAKAERTMVYLGNGVGGGTFEDSIPDVSKESMLQSSHGNERAVLTTLDDFVAEQKVAKVDFLKIDCEGYEANILLGAKKTIQAWKPVIAMSAYHRPGDKEKLPELLRSICPEYVCELHTQGDEDFICRVV